MKGYSDSECSMSIQMLGMQVKAAAHRATAASFRANGSTA